MSPLVTRSSVAVLLLTLVLTPLTQAKGGKELYRYRNNEGNIVVDYQVPVEYVARGYEVLNDEGIVVSVVPRELTEEERNAKHAEQKREEAAIAEQQRLREWDETLMLRYSTVEDVEAARDRALRDLQIRVSILKGNRRGLKQSIENYQAQAAELERSGYEVDVERLQQIEILQQEVSTTERSIVERQVDIDELKKSYEMDVERFGMLQEAIEMRRTLRIKRANR